MTLGDRVVVMHQGVVQQCASALEIYHQPANRYVAGFLGSPPMSFFTGKLVERAGSLCFDEGSGQLTIADWAAPELRPLWGKEVVMGVRPESMADQGHARFKANGSTLPMRVTLVQQLGSRMDVHLATTRHAKVVAQLDASLGMKAGDTLDVCFDMNRVHFFEPGEIGPKLAHNPQFGLAS